MNQPVEPRIRYFGFTGSIDSPGVTRIAATLNRAVNTGCTEAFLAFSSLGGYVSDGVYLYNHIRSLPITLTIYNIGSVSSIAVAVFVAAQRRICSAHSLFMIHPSVITPQGGQTWQHLQGSLDAALAEDQRTEAILRERTGLTNEFLNARRFKDVHILPAEALRQGLVHEIAEFALPQGEAIVQI